MSRTDTPIQVASPRGGRDNASSTRSSRRPQRSKQRESRFVSNVYLHCNNPGNDKADRLAKDAASPGKTHPFRPLLTKKRALIRDTIRAQWEREWKASTKGGHLWKIDSIPRTAYTRKLYGNLPRSRAYLLIQLRTGRNWLSTYAKTFGFRDDDRCVCGAQETVTHMLVDCPNLRDIRWELRSEAGDAFNSMSSLLGGSTEGK